MGEKIAEPTRAIIFAGGDVRNYRVIKSIIKDDDLIVCADSGYLHCRHIGVEPDYLIGDFDSLKEVPEDIPKYSLPEDKNFTDTTFAIESVMHKGCTSIVLVGALGGRIDHTLANIQSLVYCAKKGIEAFVLDGETQILCVYANDGPQTFKISPVEDYYFSLLAYSEKCEAVTIKDAMYLLDRYDLESDMARAVSNEFIGKDVEISFESGTMLVVLTPKNR